MWLHTYFMFVKIYHTFPDCSECSKLVGGTCGLKTLVYLRPASPTLLFAWIVFISVRSCWIIDWSAFISFSLIAIKFCKLSTVNAVLHCVEQGWVDVVLWCYIHILLRGSSQCARSLVTEQWIICKYSIKLQGLHITDLKQYQRASMQIWTYGPGDQRMG